MAFTVAWYTDVTPQDVLIGLDLGQKTLILPKPD